ncbi:MAG: hypothetical protein AAF961_13525, partial [Planctomycetota bacterium]
MNSGVNLLCFSASYAIALALEALGLWHRPRWRRLATLAMAAAGLAAQTWYLGRRAEEEPAAPLSSHHDWYIAAAWVLAMIYLATIVYYPRRSFGLFLLPLTLGLIAASAWAPIEPLASVRSRRIWGQLHGLLLMLGTIAVLLGFVAGLMYLLQ